MFTNQNKPRALRLQAGFEAELARRMPLEKVLRPVKLFAAVRRGTTLGTISSDPLVKARAPDPPRDMNCVQLLEEEQV